MEHLNYCRQLCAEIETLGQKGQDAHVWRDVLDRVTKAAKFILPDGGITIDDFELRAIGDEKLRLPFDDVVLEIPVGKHPRTGSMVKAIVLCKQRPDAIWVTPIAGMTGESWSLKSSFELPATGYADKKKEKWGIIVPDYAYGIALWVLLFLNALACSNVHATKSAASNKPKKGALPFDDYHILTIAPAQSLVNQPRYSEHRSPREHLRRGHIRRLEDGRRIWVNATVVSAGRGGGSVKKDYAVRAAV